MEAPAWESHRYATPTCESCHVGHAQQSRGDRDAPLCLGGRTHPGGPDGQSIEFKNMILKT